MYCTVSCLKSPQKIKNDAIDAYAQLITELKEFEPEILAKPALEEGLSKIMPKWVKVRVSNVQQESDKLKTTNDPQ